MEYLYWLPWLAGTFATCGLLFAASHSPQVRRRGVSRLLIYAGILIATSAGLSLLMNFVFSNDVFVHDSEPEMWLAFAYQLPRIWLLQLLYCAALLIVAYAVLKAPHAPRGCDPSASGETLR